MSAKETTPLLDPVRKGGASTWQAFGNIIVSIVGTGVLGLPYAFKMSGWACSLVAIVFAALLAYYCMMLLVKCRDGIEQLDDERIVTYGDLAGHTCGKLGRYIAETTLVISQLGGCVAYFVFVAQNMSSIVTGSSGKYASFIILLVPIEIALAWVQNMSSLAPLSIVADVCNVMAMALIVKEEVGMFQGMGKVQPFKGWHAFPFVIGTSVFCFDGFATVLSMEASMKIPKKFGMVLGKAILLITLIYAGFGFAGYLSYGEETLDIVTLNLPNDWSAVSVKLGLSIAVLLACPIIMLPVYEMFEMKLEQSCWLRNVCSFSSWFNVIFLRFLRALVILFIAFLASFVPGFGVFVSFMGCTLSAMLGFVFPSLFHLRLFHGRLHVSQIILDTLLIFWGLVFAIYGTYATSVGIFK